MSEIQVIVDIGANVEARDEEIAALTEELQLTRNALAEAILQLGGALELRPRLTPSTWTMRGPERTADGAFIYRVTEADKPEEKQG